jgi:hypothetical protein
MLTVQNKGNKGPVKMHLREVGNKLRFKEMTAWSLRSSWKYPLCLIKIFSDSSRYLVSVKEVLKGETATGGLAPFQGYGA